MPKRVAFSRDLGGITPVDPEVAAIVERAARRFEALGCIVEEASPDFADLQMIFQTLRAMGMAASRKGLLASHRDRFKPEVGWHIAKGRSLIVVGSLGRSVGKEGVRTCRTRRPPVH